MKFTTKQLMLILMCALLAATLIISCFVIGKALSLFSTVTGSGETTAPSESIAPSSEPTEPTESEPTEATEPEPTEPEPSTEPHVHEYTKKSTTKATCDGMGFSLYTCKCGKVDTRDFVDALGHNYGPEETIELTCEQDGCTRKVCSRCGDVERWNITKATGHDYQPLEKPVKPTCTEEGYDGEVCTHCGDAKKKDIVDALGHDFGDWEPVEDDPDKEQRVCENCDKVETRDAEEDPTGSTEASEATEPSESTEVSEATEPSESTETSEATEGSEATESSDND